MNKYKQIRNYEVSVWTLQDSFITVLKWTGIESKGQIQDGIQILDIDGTQEFSFTIPMYLNCPDDIGNNIKKENPIWYNTKNGVLMASMRKIKVILNKQTEEEKIYEYLITKVTERHEKGELYCDVSCEGLAFHELGKIGYKLALSSDDFYYDYDSWFKEDGTIENQPHQTIQYWNNKFLTPYPEDPSKVIPNIWYYEVKMNWASTERHKSKDSNKVYEDEYVSSWDMEEGSNVLIPTSFSSLKEKERAIDVEGSNIYNITQKIAEIFEVFCKYEYEYDENYHITARKVVYYNNLIEEQNGYLNLTYPYHTSKITREMDGTDLVTKMYVQIQDEDIDTLNIMDVAANKSKENYILNFDYLHELKVITDEQYSEIEKYENDMFRINQGLSTLRDQINIIENQKLDEESKKGIAEKGKQSAEDQINTASNNLKTLGNNEDGTITIDGFNSKPLSMIKDENTGEYFVNMPFVGIIPTSVFLIAGTLNYSNPEEPFGKEENINKVMGEMEYDEYNNLTKIIHLSSPETYNLINPTLWLQCKYLPYTYWNNVYNYWVVALNNYEEDLAKANQNLNKLNNDLDQKEIEEKQLLKEKKEKQERFNQIMGTALREGYWQPENYLDYNSNFLINFNAPDSPKSHIDSEFVYKDHATYFWDKDLLKEERDATFKQGNVTKQYLMINLNSLEQNDLQYIKDNYENLSFIYYDSSIVKLNQNLSPSSSDYQNNTKKALHSIHLGGGCKFGFIIHSSKCIPVLIITDSSLFTDEQLSFFSGNLYDDYKSKFGIINRTLDNNIVNIDIDENAITINKGQYIYGGKEDNKLDIISPKTVVNLRIVIDSLALNTSSSELFIKLHNVLLKEYNDYYITKTYDKVYITIKPEVLFKIGNINPSIKMSYSLSNTNVAIYLDAVKIAKENAYPKTSYSVELNIFDGKIIHNIYNRLSQIVNINDNELKFKNVRGYISRIEMDLDHPWQDKIEIKNYKTKFEDLFSTIIASTEAIKKNEYGYDRAAAAFGKDGTLREEILSQSLNNNPFIMNSYLNSNFDGIEIINKKLENIFNEAGVLLSTAGNSLNNLRSLSINNASILSGFYNGIQEGFANGIDYTKEITLASGDKTNISAIRINKDEGIYIGSNNKIVLSATNAIQGENGEYIGDPGLEHSGADVELSPDRLLMGVSNLTSNEGGVVDITSDQIILAVGNNVQILQNDPLSEITADQQDESGSPCLLSGVQIKKDYIGLATGDEEDRGLVSIRPTDITLGVSNSGKTGSYVKIAKTGIELGASANLYINTNNFKLQTNTDLENKNNPMGETVFAIGKNLYNIDSDTDISTLNKDSEVNFLVNKSGAYIKGDIYAVSLNLVTQEGEKDFNDYMTALEARIDDEIRTWFGKGTPLVGAAGNTNDIENIILNGFNFKCKALYKEIVNTENTYKGKWKPGEDYELNDCVSYDKQYYKCNKQHESTDDVTILSNTDYWELCLDPTGESDNFPYWLSSDNIRHVGDIYYDVGETKEYAIQKILTSKNWNQNTTYKQDACVIYKNNIYKSLKNNNKNQEPDQEDSTYWEKQYPSTIENWDENKHYDQGEYVIYENNIYISKNETQGSIPSSSSDKWNKKEIISFEIEYSPTAGNAYKFVRENSTVYKWQSIEDTRIFTTADRMEKIRNGEIGLAFTNTDGNSFVTLNNEVGLVIFGEKKSGGDYSNRHPYFRVSNNAMGFFYVDSPESVIVPGNDDTGMLYYENGELYVKGNITASSFKLNNQDLDTIVSTKVTNEVSRVTTPTVTVRYYADTNYKTQTQLGKLDDANWKTTTSEAIGNKAKPYYLYTRSVTKYSGGNDSTAYSISYVGQDGNPAVYMNTIVPLYYLTDSSSTPRQFSENEKIISTSTDSDEWSTVIPIYIENYEYYRCTQYEWSNGDVTHSNVYKDAGLTAMYKHMTDASYEAATAANAISPITAYGLIGQNISKAGQNDEDETSGISYDSDGYPKWNGNAYGLILGNSSSKSMLIGSNGGITIAGNKGDQTGEAIVLNKQGISLYGATINLTSAVENGTSVISLGEEGISLASTRGIEMLAGDGYFKAVAANGSLVYSNIGTDTSDDVEINVSPGVIKCKKLICESIEINGSSLNVSPDGISSNAAGNRINFSCSTGSIKIARIANVIRMLGSSRLMLNGQLTAGEEYELTLSFGIHSNIKEEFTIKEISMYEGFGSSSLVHVFNKMFGENEIKISSKKSTLTISLTALSNFPTSDKVIDPSKGNVVEIILYLYESVNSVNIENTGYFYPSQSYVIKK